MTNKKLIKYLYKITKKLNKNDKDIIKKYSSIHLEKDVNKKWIFILWHKNWDDYEK